MGRVSLSFPTLSLDLNIASDPLTDKTTAMTNKNNTNKNQYSLIQVKEVKMSILIHVGIRVQTTTAKNGQGCSIPAALIKK